MSSLVSPITQAHLGSQTLTQISTKLPSPRWLPGPAPGTALLAPKGILAPSSQGSQCLAGMLEPQSFVLSQVSVLSHAGIWSLVRI